MWRFALPAVAFVVLAAFLYNGLGRNVGELPSPLIGKPAPQFSLEALHDPTRTFSRDDLRGRVSLVNVWGTWCPECQTEHPVLMRIAASGVPIYSINWKDDDALAKRWLVQFGDPYVVTGADRDGRAAIEWGVYGAPETFVVDAAGIVRHKHVGPISEEIWRMQILPAVQSAANEADGITRR